MTTHWDILLAHIEIDAVKYGEFTLSSGKKSDMYVDMKKVLLHPRGLACASRCVKEVLDSRVEMVGGPEVGVIPLVGSMMARGAAVPPYVQLDGFIVRKSDKTHGLGNRVEGNCEGQIACILEDVTTTGASVSRAIKAAQEAGLFVVQAITVFDRLEGAQELLEREHPAVKFDAVIDRKDLRP